MNGYIGILDSGVGGISVLREAARLLPNENFIYYGDNKNAPYGPKPIEEIRRLSKEAVVFLLDKNVKALVLACNTITAAYAQQLRSEVDIPVIGMEPAVKPASLARCGGKILALATKATLALEKFSLLMERYGDGVIPLEGKGLVEIVESGKHNGSEAAAALKAIFEPYLEEQIDGIVLGCTHYPFLKRQIKQFFPDVLIFDGLEGTVRQLKRRLQETNRLNSDSATGNIQFYTSGSDDTIRLMKALFHTDV